tara:strand:- start:5 stop:169 length:165 start_codon:yes stop_codon:yes gene_type:complete
MKQLWLPEILELERQVREFRVFPPKKKSKAKKKKKQLNCTLRMEEPDEGWSGIV